MDLESKRARLIAAVAAAMQLGAIDCAKHGASDAEATDAARSLTTLTTAESDAASDGGLDASDASDASDAAANQDAGPIDDLATAARDAGVIRSGVGPRFPNTNCGLGTAQIGRLGKLTSKTSCGSSCGAVARTGLLISVTIAPAVVTSGAMPDLDATLAKSRGRIRACYQQSLNQDPAIAGKATLELSLSAEGAVAASVVSPGGLPDGALACVVRALRTMKLTASKGPATARVDVSLTHQN